MRGLGGSRYEGKGYEGSGYEGKGYEGKGYEGSGLRQLVVRGYGLGERGYKNMPSIKLPKYKRGYIGA